MYLQHFSLTHAPLGKGIKDYIDMNQYSQLKKRLDWLLDSKGIGVVTGETGVGKTTALRKWAESLNPLEYRVIYQSDNQFTAFDIYTQLADSLNLETKHRYCRLWRQLKNELTHLYKDKNITPIWILDEAQQLGHNFFSELPSFLNLQFDTLEIMVIILMGSPRLQSILQRSAYSALVSRVQFHHNWHAIEDLNAFSKIITISFEKAGSSRSLISQSGMQLIHMSAKGRLREAHRIIVRSLQIAAEQQQTHLPDEIINKAIEELRAD